MLSEVELVEKLKKLYPDRVIYTDTYLKRAGSLSYEIYKQAKNSQKSRIEWLADHGFIWRETGYVEPDMVYRDIESDIDKTSAFSIADFIFKRFPLAGEYILSDEEATVLYQSAAQTVQKMLFGDTQIPWQDEAVLVAETIELLKNWSSRLMEEEDGGTFWNYIYLQYGFNPINSEAAKNRLYEGFRAAIKRTLTHYRRFFAPKGMQRYYTSLLLHAMAPRQSIESLYNILFDFYSKNLEFQYVAEDISYKVFTKCLRARWDSRIAKNEDLQLRSDIISSGLQTLFRERPGYMAVLCDSIVRKMDTLLRGEASEEMDPSHNYWDQLLHDWYNKKSATERVRAQGEKRRRKVEYIATTSERIYAQYILNDGEVCLSLPRIRLPKVDVCHPEIRIFQGEQLIFEDDLSVTGSDLCLTTRSCIIPLQKTNFDFLQAPQLSVEIQYNGENIYQSGNKLKRKYVLFDSTGNEHIPKQGTAYLFTSEISNVDFSGEDGVYQCPYPGQLYRINLNEVSSVAVDGREIFADTSITLKFRHHTSLHRIKGLRAVSAGRDVDIFPSSFRLSLRLPESENVLRYQFSLDGIRYRLDSLERSGEDYVLSVKDDGPSIHCIRVVDLTDGLVKYEYCYAILSAFEVRTTRTLYRAGLDTVEIEATWKEIHRTFAFPLKDSDCNISFSFPGLPYTLEMDVPVIQCTFMGENAFTAPEAIWHSDIDAGEFIALQLPPNWKGQLMLDASPVPTVQDGAKFELGNTLRSEVNTQGERILWLSLKDDCGHHEHFSITSVIFSPKFLHAPLGVVDGKLCWQAEENYFGDPNPMFEILLDFSDKPPVSYQASEKDAVLCASFNPPNGRYSYRVLLKKKSAFSNGVASQVVYQGELVVGDPHELAFMGKEILLGDALCWNFEEDTLKTVYMEPGCGLIQELSYNGETVASGEAVAAPCYTGTMYFIDLEGRHRPFNSNPANADFELVNPVKLWIINEHLLILRCATDDTVYIDSRYSTIVNRSPSATMNKYEQKSRLKTPDYFKYQIREV